MVSGVSSEPLTQLAPASGVGQRLEIKTPHTEPLSTSARSGAPLSLDQAWQSRGIS